MATPFVEAMAEGAAQALPSLPGAQLTWLDAARREQLQAFLSEGLPGPRSEAFKYTSLRALERRAFAPIDADAGEHAVDAQALALPGVEGPRLVFVNGAFRADLSQLDGLPEGVTLEPLSQALAGDAEPLRFFLTRHWQAPGDAFARLNAALASDGVVLRVAAGTQVAAPVHVVHMGTTAASDVAWHGRHIIELGEGARLSLIEQHAAGEAHSHFATQVTDAVLREGAQLDWLMVQEAASGATLLRRTGLRLDARSRVTLHALELGGGLVRHELGADLVGDGAQLETRGVFIPRARQHQETRLDIRHQAKSTASDALWRGVADQRGRGVFHGAITVDEGADGTDAALSNKNLLLSPHAEIDTQPVLEIYADEVTAAHGATVGQLDERSLFYLRSRGIGYTQARSLLTLAFCRAALDSVANEALREHLNGRLVAQLPIDADAR
nr:Fe-S cluster assembly protein SufD [Oleiagrimonas sp. C23AA]